MASSDFIYEEEFAQFFTDEDEDFIDVSLFITTIVFLTCCVIIMYHHSFMIICLSIKLLFIV